MSEKLTPEIIMTRHYTSEKMNQENFDKTCKDITYFALTMVVDVLNDIIDNSDSFNAKENLLQKREDVLKSIAECNKKQ